MWETIQHVTTGLSLVAFLGALIAQAYQSQSQKNERLIKSAPESERGKLVANALEFFNIDTSGLSSAQQYTLALEQIHAKAQRFRTTAIVVCFLGLVFAGVAVYAMSRPSPPDLVSPATEHVMDSRGASKISLTSATDWNFPNDVVRLKGTIVTNGKALTIQAKKLIAEDADILAVETPKSGTSGHKGSAGQDGTPGTGAGGNGGNGSDGGSGLKGEAGFAPGTVRVETAAFEGRLTVTTSGGAGGNGGAGGAGGNAGNGGQGEPSQTGILDCTSGPGTGGHGGDGGSAGSGGDGGTGGAAGNTYIQVKDSFTGQLETIAKGGSGGSEGAPGEPGNAGAGGPEGQTNGLCHSAGRNGAPGRPGAIAGVSSPGAAGADGKIDIKLPQLNTQALGEYHYETQ
nr:collagen-like protein [Pseudomonas caspiana]